MGFAMTIDLKRCKFKATVPYKSTCAHSWADDGGGAGDKLWLTYHLTHNLHEPVSAKHLAMLRKEMADTEGSLPVLVYGPRGAGKTRLVLEYLHHNFGLLLVAGDSTTSGGGSGETLMQAMLKQAGTALCDMKPAEVKQVLVPAVMARMVVFLQLRRDMPSMTPAQWLYIQYSDAFRAQFVRIALRLSQYELSTGCWYSTLVAYQYYVHMAYNAAQLPVFIDDVHAVQALIGDNLTDKIKAEPDRCRCKSANGVMALPNCWLFLQPPIRGAAKRKCETAETPAASSMCETSRPSCVTLFMDTVLDRDDVMEYVQRGQSKEWVHSFTKAGRAAMAPALDKWFAHARPGFAATLATELAFQFAKSQRSGGDMDWLACTQATVRHVVDGLSRVRVDARMKPRLLKCIRSFGTDGRDGCVPFRRDACLELLLDLGFAALTRQENGRVAVFAEPIALQAALIALQ